MAGKNEFLHRLTDSFYGFKLNLDNKVCFFEKNSKFRTENFSDYQEQDNFLIGSMIQKATNSNIQYLEEHLTADSLMKTDFLLMNNLYQKYWSDPIMIKILENIPDESNGNVEEEYVARSLNRATPRFNSSLNFPCYSIDDLALIYLEKPGKNDYGINLYNLNISKIVGSNTTDMKNVFLQWISPEIEQIEGRKSYLELKLSEE